jgi:Trk-type K+ transport system membrane component
MTIKCQFRMQYLRIQQLKINSMILMLLGRLEIYPFFLIFGNYKR